jgi:2,4-dienoyl-CoA reductase-like NADH-dependent reductase (Old Yellow Enzyme family)
VAFGRLFLANPDLPARLQRQAPLNAPNPATFTAAARKVTRTIPPSSDQRTGS